MDIAKLEKLKVVELKAELQARNLDTKGVKAVLIERLKDAIEKGVPLIDGAVTSEFSASDSGEAMSTPQKKARRRSTRSQTRSPSPAKKPSLEQEPALETLKEEDSEPQVEAEKKEDSKVEEDNIVEENQENKTDSTIVESEKMEDEETSAVASSAEDAQETAADEEMKDVDNKENGDNEKEEPKAEAENEDSSNKDQEKEDHDEKSNESETKESRSDRKRSHSRSRSPQSRSRSRSRSPRSRSKSPRRRSPAKNTDDFTNEEDEPVVEENQIGLSWFDSDLHLLIDPVSFTSAKPMSEPVFDLVWSGARANYGVKEGKVCFEVRISEETNLSSHFKDEPFVRGLRCGFSTTETPLLLGESQGSFAYCENGKKAVNGEFVEFGKPFGLDDVIGCYLDLDNTPCTIQYTLNGENLGNAFEFEKDQIFGEGETATALFPHILVKGYEIQVNFADSENLLVNVVGPKREKKEKKKVEDSEDKKTSDEVKANGNEEKEKMDEGDEANTSKEEGDKEMNDVSEEEKKKDEDKEETVNEEQNNSTSEEASPVEEETKPREHMTLLPDFQLIGLIDENKFISGPQRYESRKDCEVYLLVGLHGSGKTHWAKNHIQQNPEKRYNVIGPDSLIAKMTIDGAARKPHHVGKWDKVYDYCINSLSSLEEIATKRRRNFILDQTNAFASAQRRKMKGFGDFKRIAVVCIPTYEDLKKRIEMKSGEDNSVEIRESAVDKLKANFTLPSTEFGWFEDVQFTDLKDDEAKAEVKKYNEKGKRAVDHSSRNKRPRNDYRRDDRRRYDDRRRDYRGYRDNRDRRGPPNRFGGGSGGYSNNRSGGGSGGYRDDRHRNYDRSGGGGSGGSRYGAGNGSSGGSSWVHGRRGYDDRYRSGGGGGAGAGRYDSYGGGRNDYRERYDRDRDRNGSSRRNESYRSGGQRDFRAGHRRIEDRDSRDGGFDRASSKYNSNDDFDRNSSNSKSTNSSNNAAKWGASNSQQAGGWAGMSQQQAQPSFWGYDQSGGYSQQATAQQQWNVNSADPRQQQQWMAYWQGGSQQSQQPQYWPQYQTGYQNNDTTSSSK